MNARVLDGEIITSRLDDVRAYDGVRSRRVFACIIDYLVVGVLTIPFAILVFLFGIITLVNLSVGMLTPPVGLNLFVAMTISGLSLFQVFRAALPTIALMVVALIVITYVPWFSLALPKLMY